MRIEPIGMAPLTSMTVAGRAGGAQPGPSSFSEILSGALGQVNDLQNQAAQANVRLAAGQIEDVSEVMIAAEKASVALQMTMQVRNKIVDAYQEIMRMQV